MPNSDVVATYLVGPAFGWQHVRLCADRSRDAYRPTLGDERSTHPADEARLRGVVAVLERMGASETARQVMDIWGRYLAVSGESRQVDDPDLDIPFLLGEAWGRFLNDPATYDDWEHAQIEDLSRDLG